MTHSFAYHLSRAIKTAKIQPWVAVDTVDAYVRLLVKHLSAAAKILIQILEENNTYAVDKAKLNLTTLPYVFNDKSNFNNLTNSLQIIEKALNNRKLELSWEQPLTSIWKQRFTLINLEVQLSKTTEEQLLTKLGEKRLTQDLCGNFTTPYNWHPSTQLPTEF